MNEQKSPLVKKIERIVNNSKAENILNVLKVGLATTPFCGGIATLMSDYIPSGKQRRLEAFAEKLAADLTELQDRVDEAKLLTDEFAFLFERCFRGVAENYHTTKLEAFRAILINAAIGSDFSEEQNEYFLSLVNNLSVLHIRIIKFMADPEFYLEANKISPERISGGFSQFFPEVIPGVDLNVIKSAYGDLFQSGLVNTDKTIFKTVTSGQGLALLGNRVTELGKNFVAFCTQPQ